MKCSLTICEKQQRGLFFSDLAITTVVTCYYAIIKNNSDIALTKGVGFGFGAAIVVFCIVTACFDWKDRRGVSND